MIVVTAKTIENDCDTLIYITTDLSNSELCFMIDTGAQTSIVKAEKLHKTLTVTKSDSMNFKGVSQDTPIKSYGSVMANFRINNANFEHKLYIVGNKINLNMDGILGHDFLKTFGAQIDYSNGTIKLQTPINARLRVKQDKSTDTDGLYREKPQEKEHCRCDERKELRYRFDGSIVVPRALKKCTNEKESATSKTKVNLNDQIHDSTINLENKEKMKKNKNFYRDIPIEYILKKTK